MKRLVIIVLIVAGLVVAWKIAGGSQSREMVDMGVISTNGHSPTPIHSPVQVGRVIKYQDKEYAYNFWQADQSELLRLIPNYAEKRSTTRIIEDNKCRAGINGGLYDTSNAPLGWVVVKGEELARFRPSQIYNGVVGVTSAGEFYVGEHGELEFNYAVQTGPVLVRNGQTVGLSLSRDKQARRMVAALTEQDKLQLIAIYTPQSVFDGPLLDDLPEIVAEIGKQQGGYAGAINLDGGSASAIFSSEFELSEWEPVGSWWCYGLNSD